MTIPSNYALLEAYLAGYLTEEQCLAIEERLKREPDLADALLQLAREETVIQDWARTVARCESQRNVPAAEPRAHETAIVSVSRPSTRISSRRTRRPSERNTPRPSDRQTTRPADSQASSGSQARLSAPFRVHHRDPENLRFPVWGLPALAAAVLLLVVARLFQAPTQPPPRRKPVPVVAAVAPAGLGELTGVERTLSNAGPAMVLRVDGQREAARPGTKIMIADRLETHGSSVHFQYAGEATRLDFAADSIATFYDAQGAKRIHLTHGMLEANVAHQASDRPMTLTTPHAVATVVGTRFWLSVAADLTRLDVNEGQVRFVRYADGTSSEVGAGQWASSTEAATVLDWRPQLAVQMTGPNYDLIRPIAEGCFLSRKFLTRTEDVRIDLILRALPQEASSVLFAYDGVWRNSPVSVPPYRLTGADGAPGDQPQRWLPALGPHAVTLVPCGPDGQKLGSGLTVHFTVTE